jgi:outer membrane protein
MSTIHGDYRSGVAMRLMFDRGRIPGWMALLGALFLFPAFPARSQESTPRRLSLDDAVHLAIKQDPDLETARLEVERSDARVSEAWGTALPSIDLSAHYLRTPEPPVFYAVLNGVPTAIQTGLPHAADMFIQGRQILFNGAVIVGLGAAHIYAGLARDLYTNKKLETVAKVRKAYYGALVAREVVTMMRASLRNAESNLKNVLLMRMQGIVSEYDELRASLQVDNLRPSVIQSETGYGLALDMLRNTIGAGNNENLELSDSLMFAAVDDSLAEHAEAFALSANPGLQALNRQLELNKAAIFAERSNYLPTLALSGQMLYQSAINRFDAFSTNGFVRSYQFGISLSMNIFQGGQTRARVEQAQVEERKTEQQRLGMERTILTGVHSVVGNLRQARKRVEAQQKTVETAERGYKIVTARFLASAATQLEVNDAQVALDQARVNRIQALYDYLVAAADLDRLIGRLPACAQETEE